jgi:hypothetical protein
MGAEPYDYWVSYEPDIQAALDKLRAQVFESGQFRGAEYAPATAEEALEMMDADGTGSILDISRVSEQPDFFCAAPLSESELQACFGTSRPTLGDIKGSDAFWDTIERGHARYVIVYQDDQPENIFFAGYSFD